MSPSHRCSLSPARCAAAGSPTGTAARSGGSSRGQPDAQRLGAFGDGPVPDRRKGLAGHAGAILLRKAAGQSGLAGQLSAALRKKGTTPLLDRGLVLVSVAVSVALGATSMSDIALLAHLAPVLGAAPSGPTVRRGKEGAAPTWKKGYDLKNGCKHSE